MRKLIVSAWFSIDGVFDSASMDQWFIPYDSEMRQSYIRDGILDADALLLGRVTYEMLAPYWSTLKNNEMGIADKLNNIAKYVVSKSLINASWNNSKIIREDVTKAIQTLKEQPGKEIQIEGSASLVHSLAGTGLIDEYRFLVHPVIMGTGKRFFQEGMRSHGLQLVNSRPIDNGVILLSYQSV